MNSQPDGPKPPALPIAPLLDADALPLSYETPAGAPGGFEPPTFRL